MLTELFDLFVYMMLCVYFLLYQS